MENSASEGVINAKHQNKQTLNSKALIFASREKKENLAFLSFTKIAPHTSPPPSLLLSLLKFSGEVLANALVKLRLPESVLVRGRKHGTWEV